MIRHWSFYDKATGIFTGASFAATDASSLEVNTPEGFAALEGKHDHLCQRVDIETGVVVSYQPPQPSAGHEWDESVRRWRLNAEHVAREARNTAAHARIAHLETNVQPRALREVALNQPKAVERLQAIDGEIAVLRRDIIG